MLPQLPGLFLTRACQQHHLDDLARLDVMGRGQGESRAFRRSIPDRGKRPETGGLSRLPVGSLARRINTHWSRYTHGLARPPWGTSRAS